MDRRDETLNHGLPELERDYNDETIDPTPVEEDWRCYKGTLDAEVNTLPTVSHVDELVVYGRNDDQKRAVELLLSNRRSQLSVIPIVGVGGVGKTTLAHLVYNDPMICEHFDARGWVCVSHDFNLVRLMNAITASIGESLFAFSKLDELKVGMNRELEAKRFLLVLDDVCNEDKSLWEILRASLTVGLEGSVVLVTTRNESVATMMQTVPFYRLECLSEDDCWSLFQQCVFRCSRNPNTLKNLVSVGKGIVKKFRGFPLAAKMVGCFLSYESSEESWHNILHSDLWDSNEVVGVSSTAIALAYYNLPAHLRRCFAYFALFPKDYLYKKDPLVRLWMAEGFIQPIEGKRAEDTGIEYFDELLRRSFFQYSQINRETFVMHDLIYDLAQSISRKEICRTEDGVPWSAASDTRHSSVIPHDFGAEIQIQSTSEPRDLRTLLVIHRLLKTCDVTYISSKERLHLRIPNDLFINLECLCTLDLSETDIVELPDSIGNLKHLRYLSLNNTKIRSLPEALCSLHNLQTLDMRDCNKLVELPRDTKNLINLRHLYLPRFGMIFPPPRIGLLTNLQTLTKFYAGRRNKEHCMITELKDLVNLRGELVIAGIQNVDCVDYAKGALEDKEYLTKLILQSGVRGYFEDSFIYDYDIFDGDVEDFVLLQLFNDEPRLDHESQACKFDDVIEEKPTEEKIFVPKKIALKKKKIKVADGLEEGVFEFLRPHTNLAELVIQSYYSVRFPSWMGDPSFSNLVSVKLDICSECKILPPLGQLPSLRHLVVEESSKLESIGREFYGQGTKCFPSLETLHFRRMYKWEEWDGAECGEFPRLHELNLYYCPKLRRIPRLLQSLKKLVMWMCEELTVLPILPSLAKLELQGQCNEKIWPSVSQGLLPGLQSLKIHGLEGLASLRLHNFSALTELEIHGYVNSTSPCSSFGQQLSNMASLKSLKMSHCPGIRFTQDQELPAALDFVDISYCPLLIEWCHRFGSSKLVHIARVILDRKDFHPLDEGDTFETCSSVTASSIIPVFSLISTNPALPSKGKHCPGSPKLGSSIFCALA